MKSFFYSARSLVFYIGYVLIIFFYGVLARLIAYRLDVGARSYCLSRMGVIVLWWAKLSCGIRYRIEGRENLRGGCGVVLSNHESVWETFLFTILLHPQAAVIKQELLGIPLFGWMLKATNPIALDRQKPAAALKQLIVKGKQRLKEGAWIIMYPEGTRVRVGQQVEFSKGGAALAKSAGVDVIPVAHNAGHCWPADKWVKKPGVVTIKIGPRIATHDLNRNEVHQKMESWIRKARRTL